MRQIVCCCLFSTLLGCSSAENNETVIDDAANNDESFDGPTARGEGRYSMALVSEEDELTVSTLEPEFDEDACGGECDANTAPVLGEPIFVVNGVLQENLQASVDDDLVVLIPFEDAECNLSCGTQSTSHSEPQGGGDGIGSLPTNVPCSTAQSDVYLRITPASYPMDPGSYSYSHWVSDECGAQSETAQIGFELR